SGRADPPACRGAQTRTDGKTPPGRRAQHPRAWGVPATTFTAPSAASAAGSRDGGTGPTAAVGSNSRRQQEITNIDSTVAATIAVIISRGRVLENAAAIIESIVIRQSETNARDSADIRLDTAPAATYAALRA